MPLTKEKLESLKAVAERATPGPWKEHAGKYVGFLGQCFFSVQSSDTMVAPERIQLENAAHIAAFNPATALALIAEINRLRERECSHGDYRPMGTAGCISCQTGRIETYYLYGKCSSCRSLELQNEGSGDE